MRIRPLSLPTAVVAAPPLFDEKAISPPMRRAGRPRSRSSRQRKLGPGIRRRSQIQFRQPKIGRPAVRRRLQAPARRGLDLFFHFHGSFASGFLSLFASGLTGAFGPWRDFGFGVLLRCRRRFLASLRDESLRQPFSCRSFAQPRPELHVCEAGIRLDRTVAFGVGFLVFGL